jgi:hypothetical protein
MDKKQRLHNKLSAALRAAGIPRWMHRFGPKKFTTYQLILGLVVRAKWARTYRDAARFLDEYHGISMHWTTLQKAAKRLPQWAWHAVMRATASIESMLAAIDSTGFSRTNPSAHYLHRIDGQVPVVPIKVSALVDCDSRRVLAARVRVRPAHEVRDVAGLLWQAARRPWAVVMDKAYDSQPLHERLDRAGVWSITPPRTGCRHGRHRVMLRDAFPAAEYAQRNIIEAVFKSIKTRFGGHVRSRTARTVRAEVFARIITYNLLYHAQHFLLTPREQCF